MGSYSDLAKWAALYAPWLVQRDAVRYLMRSGRSHWFSVGAAGSGGPLIIAGFRVLALTVAALALQVLLLISLPFQRLLRGLALLLTATVGDSHAFVARPEAFEAMVDKVRVDLAAAADRSDRLIVVAHSQGAAVAHAALVSGGAPDNVVALITLGAGLQKLLALQEALRRPRQLWIGAISRWGLIVLAMFLVFTTSWDNPLVWVAAIALMFAPMIGMRPIGDAVAARIRDLAQRRDLVWWDHFSALDPVPGGVLPELNELGDAAAASVRVRNRSSWLFDHVAYRENNAEVWAPVYELAMYAVGHQPIDTELRQSELLVLDRRFRTWVLWLGRAWAWVVGIGIVAGTRELEPGGSVSPWVYLPGVAFVIILDGLWRRMWARWHAEATAAEARLERLPLRRDPRRLALWCVFPLFVFGIAYLALLALFQSMLARRLRTRGP
jgi:hypothetical protein